jgi:hypothetical protein
MGSDSTKHRDVLLLPKGVTQRLFQATPEGDRANRHVSIVVFSKSNGWYKDDEACINGAPPPMIIHSKPSSSSKDKGSSAREKRMQLYDSGGADDDVMVDQSYLEGFTPSNPLGITVRTSTNGSMTKELFLDLACHFVRHLGPDQGSKGMYTFLLTDSHVSRWHPKALYMLMKNRVIPLFFPSHLSIVVQPQDNGVILFLHKCIEETSSMQRLFRSQTDISYINRTLEKAFILFRDRERKKLMDRGSNSTTRSYRATGMKPCDPFSDGWRENLELYASFNGLQVDRRQGPYYGIRPKDEGVCPEFTEFDLSLLNEAMPLLAKEGANDISVLDHPKTKCYAVANEIIADWIEKPYDERTIRPRASTPVEKLAMRHMNIAHILSANPVSSESTLLLDSMFMQKKREAILGQTKANECIQIRPNDANDTTPWCTAIKMTSPNNRWHVFDGVEASQISTIEIDEEWKINLAYDMFPVDKKLKESRWRSGRRRRDEKGHIIRTMAETLAGEERNGELKREFDLFMKRPTSDQTFAEFKESIVKKIEKPSEHSVTVNFGAEAHTMTVCAHGDNFSSMSHLVMENICKTLVCVATRGERKSGNSGKRRGGKVVSVKRGSDGFQKMLQIDEQQQKDLRDQDKDNRKTVNARLILCRRRLKELRRICLIRRYHSIWNQEADNLLICNSKILSKPRLLSFLKVYNVEGRTKLYKESRDVVESKMNELSITRGSFERMEEDLLEELRVLGGIDNFQVDQSFESSFEMDSDSSSSDRPSLDGELINVFIERDNSSTDDSDSDNSEKIVSFNDTPTIHPISPRKSIQLPETQRAPSEASCSTSQSTKRPPKAKATIQTTRRNPSRRRAPPRKLLE